MQVLEINVRKKVKRIENPVEARVLDLMLVDVIQVKDEKGKWHNIFFGTLSYTERVLIVMRIEKAIEEEEESIRIYI